MYAKQNEHGLKNLYERTRKADKLIAEAKEKEAKKKQAEAKQKDVMFRCM